VTVTVEAQAQNGTLLTIEQAVGTCDGSKAKTEMFRVTETDGKGNVLSMRHERAHDERKASQQFLETKNGSIRPPDLKYDTKGGDIKSSTLLGTSSTVG